ncbi:Cytochrome P450 4V3 [Cyphomyrmex costatus]|uniref:Cytochrome P450 4V3 n=1 Tax=Cyphomyrmex costatus TaxID=456900 RepID=A0A195C8E2_9HYME|nr:Cytochrome P450 4V3 [Cyphomyrmex costatus]
MVTVPSWCTRPTNSGSPSSVSPPGIAFGGTLPPFTGTHVGLQPQRTCARKCNGTFRKLKIIAFDRFFYVLSRTFAVFAISTRRSNCASFSHFIFSSVINFGTNNGLIPRRVARTRRACVRECIHQTSAAKFQAPLRVERNTIPAANNDLIAFEFDPTRCSGIYERNNEGIIQQQLHELSKLHETETKTNTNKTFFNVLMEASCKKNFTQKMILDNVITMITLVCDKISITTNFVVFILANFPEVQEKVYKELLTIYGTETPISAPVKCDDLQHMLYLDRVIEETMRLFPTIPVIGRRLTEDVKIGDSILQKNTNIIIVLMLMNRQEQYWPNPLEFDPDRFLPERIKNCPLNYHIPFSDGPKNCIGTKYAMISMKVILATLIRTFVFKVDRTMQIRNMKLKTDVTLSTIEPLKIRIKKRDL